MKVEGARETKFNINYASDIMRYRKKSCDLNVVNCKVTNLLNLMIRSLFFRSQLHLSRSMSRDPCTESSRISRLHKDGAGTGEFAD